MTRLKDKDPLQYGLLYVQSDSLERGIFEVLHIYNELPYFNSHIPASPDFFCPQAIIILPEVFQELEYGVGWAEFLKPVAVKLCKGGKNKSVKTLAVIFHIAVDL